MLWICAGGDFWIGERLYKRGFIRQRERDNSMLRDGGGVKLGKSGFYGVGVGRRKKESKRGPWFAREMDTLGLQCNIEEYIVRRYISDFQAGPRYLLLYLTLPYSWSPTLRICVFQRVILF